MSRFRLLALLLVLFFCVNAFAQDGSKTSTPEERQHWVDVLHRLEAQPTNQENISEAEHVIKRLIIVEDVHIKMCDVIGELPSKYSESKPISQMFMIGLAAYQVETGKTDGEGSNLYALRSALKGYAAIVAADPKAHDKKLDDLVKMDAEGKLPQMIKKKKGCD